MKVSKQFVDIGNRRVLVRYAGKGPALLVLHQSPQNSRSLIPWIERLAPHYAVFAPDTPGFGDSDPLPLAQPEIPDYAAAVASLLDKLGIARAIVYGVHTGAVTALRLALDFPEKIAALACDGYARFNAAEREALLSHYLPPFEPSWDGSHLSWLFARMREQHFFFPWHDGTKAARLAYPMPSPARVHEDVLDVLAAGDGYRVGYRAPFLYDDATAAARLTVPTAIYYRAEDVLAPHLARLPGRPAHVTAELVAGGATALLALVDAFFAAHASKATVRDANDCIGPAQSNTRAVISTSAGELGFRVVRGRGSDTVIHLHDIGTASRTPVASDTAAITLLPDLPGHAASRDWAHTHCSTDVVGQALMTLLDSLDLDRVAIVTVGGSAAIGVALAHLLGARCQRLTLQDPLPLNATERAQFLSLLPDLTPVATGAEFIAAFNFVRMKCLFWPWLPQDGRAARQTMAPAALRVHADVVDILRADKCFHALWRDALAMDLGQTLLDLDAPIELIATEQGEPLRLAAQLASALGLRLLTAPGTTGESTTWRK